MVVSTWRSRSVGSSLLALQHHGNERAERAGVRPVEVTREFTRREQPPRNREQ
ncbi:hypothetical protein ACFQH2_05495 [Natronoarchaeum sp. GCM10025703]|uniref:hypothetical protein n=1 Tax=Natronoarchaeum sp. GCM10025703 TaxID=3252685 RepID=UPI00361C8264